MILFDAIFINGGGGKVLLDLVIRKSIEKDAKLFFLLDIRLKDQYPNLSNDNVYYIKPSLIRRFLFYRKYKNEISSVCAFANIPPPIRLKCPSVTYFQNVLFFQPLKQPVKFKIKILQFLKQLIIRRLSKNTNTWIVQTESVRGQLIELWNIDRGNILCMPIFGTTTDSKKNQKKNIIKNEASFLYVSTGEYHKNHFRLLEGFKIFNRQYPKTKLIVTIDKRNTMLCQHIERMHAEGINVINEGIISREQVEFLYAESNCIVYPSLVESFGLGLIEAALFNLPIMASNLAYVYDVIEPTVTFDPYSIDSIANAFVSIIKRIDEPAKIICENKIDNFIDLIASH